MEWFTEWREGATEWLLSALQNAWAWIVEVFGIVVQNPEPVASGLAASVLTILLGLVIGSAIFRHLDSKASDDEDMDIESHGPSDADDYDYDYDYDYDAFPSDTDRSFERRQ